MSKTIFFFFLAIVLNSLIWVILIPIWHFPDEQAHFAQVAFLVEKGRNSDGREFDLTEEIYISEILLGTARDKFGNNKFTFHPEYRIEYTDSNMGKYEESITILTNTEAKKNFVIQEASRYPLLYYFPAAVLYRGLYQSDLIIRVFAIRFWSLFLFLGTVLITYLIGGFLFHKNELLSVTLALLVGFQPMMVFSNIGVNSDALGNFLFALFLYLCLRIIILGFNWKKFVILLVVIYLSIYTKPQFILTIPLLGSLLLFLVVRDISGERKYFFFLGMMSLITIVLLLLYQFRIWPIGLIEKFITILDPASLGKFSLEYTFPHTYKEVLPWYWGIYDWLGVTYSRGAHRIINRILFLAGIGVLIWFYKVVKNRDWKKKEFEAIVFLNIAAIVYFIALSFYDWMLWYTSKYQLGIQGRYFFPVISVHMLMLLIGFSQLFPTKMRFKEFGIKLLGILMIILNFFALYTVGKTYYSLWPISTFIIQVSQYKPLLIKGYGFIIVFVGFLISMLIFLLKYMTYQSKKT